MSEHELQSSRTDYECPKCQGHAFETGSISTTGSGLSRFFNFQNRKFDHITCSGCGYTEFFKKTTGMAGNILDLFLGH